jgi:hypothetical protein
MTALSLFHPLYPARRPLQADGLFCAASGLILSLDADPIHGFMGMDTTLPIIVLGIGLLLYGAALFWYASNRSTERGFTITILSLNILWIVGSVVLLAADPFHFTTEGKWAVIILADVVGALAIWEFLGLRRL